MESENKLRHNGVNEVRGVEWEVRAHGEEQQVGLIVVTTGSIYSNRLNGNNSQFPASFRQFHPAQFWEIDFTNPLWIFKWATEVIAELHHAFNFLPGLKYHSTSIENIRLFLGNNYQKIITGSSPS